MAGKHFSDILRHDPITSGVIIERGEDGEVITNVPHLCTQHSPDGYEFGYGGSGPADLALNIIEAVLQQRGYKGTRIILFHGKCFDSAWQVHQSFKWGFISNLPHWGGEIPYNVIVAWLKGKLQDDNI